jgi:hypothetical protein
VAVQVVVLIEDQVSVAELPTLREVELNARVGGPGGNSAIDSSAWTKP